MYERAHRASSSASDRADEIPDAIDDGEFFDMQTFAKALIALVLAGHVDRETAANAATNRHDFEIALDRAEKLVLAKKVAAGEVEAPSVRAAEPERPMDDGVPALRVAGD